jgi:hypothetical protein
VGATPRQNAHGTPRLPKPQAAAGSSAMKLPCTAASCPIGVPRLVCRRQKSGGASTRTSSGIACGGVTPPRRKRKPPASTASVNGEAAVKCSSIAACTQTSSGRRRSRPLSGASTPSKSRLRRPAASFSPRSESSTFR